MGTWLNDNFVLLADYISYLITTVSCRQEAELKLHREREVVAPMLHVFVSDNRDKFG